MKKKFLKIVSLFLGITLFLLSGCSSKNEKEAEKAAKEYINIYYTIEQKDHEFYKYINHGFKVDEASKMDEEYKEYSKKFENIMTEKAFEEFFAERMPYGRVKKAYEDKYFVKVKKIDLEKYTEDKAQNMLVYYYNIELEQKTSDGVIKKTEKIRKQIKLFKEDEKWKVG